MNLIEGILFQRQDYAHTVKENFIPRFVLNHPDKMNISGLAYLEGVSLEQVDQIYQCVKNELEAHKKRKKSINYLSSDCKTDLK